MHELLIRAQCWWWEFRDRASSEHGATAVEYAIMLALIAIVIVTAVTLLGQETSRPFENVQAGFQT
jgi:pilus assembly protein Flp/PilA